MRVNKGVVRTRSLIFLSLEHFWRGIAGRSAERLHEGAPLEFTSEAKVSEFNATALVEENVLQLEVTVDDAFVVEICDGETELTEQQLGLVLGESTLLGKVVEQLTTAAEFGDDPDGGLCRDDLVHLGDVGVVELTMVVNLAGQGGRDGLWDLLDGDAGGGDAMGSQSHLAIRACSKRGKMELITAARDGRGDQ